MSSLRRKRCSLNVLHTSGTIKLLQKRAIEIDLDIIRKLRSDQELSKKTAERLAAQTKKDILALRD